MTQKNNIKGSLILCFTALIWGLAFVAQSGAAKYLPSFSINALRSFIAAAILFIIFKITSPVERIIPKQKEKRKPVILGALICGVMLAISVNLQQAGLSAYPKGVAAEARAGFLTALYVIIVPLFSVFLKKKVHPIVWVATVLAAIGVYLLCGSGKLGGIYSGDILMFGCAVCFSVHIVTVDKFGRELGGVRLSFLQLTVCAVISAVLSLIFESGSFIAANFLSAAPQILYLGVMSSGVAYTLQIVGQKYAEPAVASISMSLESVFAALGGWVILGNRLSIKEIIGCALVFIAIISAQTPEFKKKITP